MEWVKRNAPVVLLGIALAVSVGILLRLTKDMTFLQDTWDLLMNRPDPTLDSLLTPHNEHIVLIQTAVEQLLLRVFGMTDATPEYVLQSLVLAAAAALLFVYVRRRVGDWIALFAAVLLLFLGPAWEVLLWPFELGFSGSVLFGIAMLLALERGDRRGDVVALAFLLVSFGFSSLAIPFAAAAAVDIFQKRRDRGLARAYLVAIPVALFGIWYLGWGSDAESHLSPHNVLTSPRFVLDSAAVALAGLFGFGETPLGGPTEPAWGRPLLAILIAVFVYRQVRKGGVAPGFWPIAAAAATNWFLTAFNESAGRAPVSSRYQYMSAVLILLLLANLLQGVRLSSRALVVGATVTVIALLANLTLLRDGRDVLMLQSVYTQSDLGAIEIAERTVNPGFRLDAVIAGTPTLVNVRADKYLAAVKEYGSPAYTPAELASAPDYGRNQADIVLSRALPLSTIIQLGAFDSRSSGENCVTLPAGDSSDREIRLSSGRTRIELAPGPPARFFLRRFATGEYPVRTEGAAGDSMTLLRTPPDTAPRYPWYLYVEATQLARVCR
jgi:hypothetical protein